MPNTERVGAVVSVEAVLAAALASRLFAAMAVVKGASVVMASGTLGRQVWVEKSLPDATSAWLIRP